MRERGDKGGGMMFGLLLILFGAALLLGRFDILDLDSVWQHWPWLFILWGLFRIVQLASPRRVGGGVTTLGFGLWFLVNETRWNGLHWSNSWPLVFVVIGAGMVTRGVLERTWRPASGAEEVRDGRC